MEEKWEVETDPYVELATGQRFYVDNPEFSIEAVAHALSMNCRFNGHTAEFMSVAEHCVLVSHLMESITGGDPFEGLLHDAAEFIVTDIPSPLKPGLPDLMALERKLDLAVRKQFKLPETKSPECKEADMLALFIEARHLMWSRGHEWVDPYNLRPRALELYEMGWVPDCLTPMSAKALFMQRYRTLYR